MSALRIDDPDQLVVMTRSSISKRNEVLAFLYKHQALGLAIRKNLASLGCKQDESEDIFIDSLTNFTKACNNEKFLIRTSIQAYLIVVSRNLFIRRVSKRMDSDSLIENNELIEESKALMLLQSEDIRMIFDKIFIHLDEKCRKILGLWSLEMSMKDIATHFGYKSIGMAKKKKHQCLGRARDLVHENVELKKELLEYL